MKAGLGREPLQPGRPRRLAHSPRLTPAFLQQRRYPLDLALGRWVEADPALVREQFRARDALREMGGADKVARQHQFGKLTVRERIDELVDPGSFHEIGAIAGK